MQLYSPAAAAKWLSERLGRSVSRPTVHLYIAAGDLPAMDTGAGSQRSRWVVTQEALEALAQRVGADGQLPAPSSGWPQRKRS